MLGKTPGTADWYLDRLGRKILAQQARYDLLEDYMLGDHPLPQGDRRYVAALRELQKKARTNYFELVTMAPVERMSVLGFRFGSSEAADPDAARIWAANDMDYQSSLLHLSAAVFGDAYMVVSPPGSSGVPVITVEDPRYFAVDLDPAKRNVVSAACKMWLDDISGQVVAVLYLPGRTYYYVGPHGRDLDMFDKAGLTSRLFSHTSGLTLTHSEPNLLGRVPVVRAGWKFTFKDVSQGEAECVVDVQDRINSEILNRLVISRSQAYKQRMIAGVKLPRTKGKSKKPPFDPAADALWIVESDNVKMFEFKEADIVQLLKAIRDDVGDMAAITKTPPHYLLGEVVNVSGDALKAAETGLVSKTKLRMRTVGWAHEAVIRLCFAYLGDPRATEPVVNVLWEDPEVKSRAELADAMTKEVSAGVPLALAMQRAKFTPEEIEFALAEKRRVEARQMALEAATQSAVAASAGRGRAEGVSGVDGRDSGEFG